MFDEERVRGYFKLRGQRGAIESGLWITAAIATSWRFWYAAATLGPDAAFAKHSVSLLVGVGFALIPVASWFVFGAPPLTQIRFPGRYYVTSKDSDAPWLGALTDVPSSDTHARIIAYLLDLARSSRATASETMSRSRFHLVMAGTLGFIGILFFYVTTKPTLGSPLQQLWILLPRVLILLFIELTAGFFLKQYSATMEEFRYYESIARQREIAVAAYAIYTNKDGADSDLCALAVKLGMGTEPGALRSGETTAALELQKAPSEYNQAIANMATAIRALSENKKSGA